MSTKLAATSAPDHATDAPALEAVGVHRRFGSVRAVDGVDLRIERGEVVALLGPNGAGKTTFLDMALGFTTPSSGRIRTLGEDPAQAVRRGRASAVLQVGGLLDDLTVAETVTMVAACHLAPLPVEAVLARAGLEALAKRKVVKCSGGERQRLRFALAILTEPDLLFLDEPTAGMDVRARAEFWATMHAEAERGRTIVFATHYLAEASDFADRIVLMRSGRIHAEGTVAELTASRTRTLTCTWTGRPERTGTEATSGSQPTGTGVTAGTEAASGTEVTAEAFARAHGARLLGAKGSELTFTTDDSDGLARAILATGVGHDLRITRASLDDVFLELTEQELS
ncbi:ABC-2 type transport system ATP-binding protein [Brevibacterium sanguinis]|uniref:ABC-2 type transport system ATP-binding protein n=2 Tax=Brevibacterium TaxID=1696 RepID=A0A366IJQ2_9MICO|nr:MULTISPECIES: ABC transporter ATP-binding protein [Brevibacterium]RBP61619.1 ABC-2 type transport system ATP-binding protein [Brevibacterium sanguinis]RBP70871.1 ABC-2 type transport system ATP-binding protein [Brevibacterium celere]